MDPIIDQDLATFGAVNLEGPKWCGKTWTALAHSQSALFLMDPAGDFANHRLAELDPASVLDGASPRLLDEWQEVPSLWDAVRFHVDQTGKSGEFIMTGSTKPHTSPRHSGTGRIVRRRLRPMSLVESGDSTGHASIAALLAGQRLRPASSTMTLDKLISLCQRGGWPGALSSDDNAALNLAVSYLDQLARVDVSTASDSARDAAKVSAALGSLARNTATLVQIPTIRRDMAQWFGSTATDTTVRVYLDSLRALHVLEEIPAWSPNLRSSTRLRKSPKRMLVDPSLALAAIGASRDSLRADLKTFGFIFESLCLRDLLVIADTNSGQMWHYHDDSGLEVDAVITWQDGRWGAFEIKLGSAQVDAAASNLLRLAASVQYGGNRKPALLAVIVGVGGVAQTRPDGVHVIPVDLFGP